MISVLNGSVYENEVILDFISLFVLLARVIGLCTGCTIEFLFEEVIILRGILIQGVCANMTILTWEGNINCFAHTSFDFEIVLWKDLKKFLQHLINDYLMLFTYPIFDVEFVGFPQRFLKGVRINSFDCVDSYLKVKDISIQVFSLIN